MAARETMEYVMPSLCNNCTATEERCFYAVYADMLRAAVAVRAGERPE
jgi:hypothetical protein